MQTCEGEWAQGGARCLVSSGMERACGEPESAGWRNAHLSSLDCPPPSQPLQRRRKTSNSGARGVLEPPRSRPSMEPLDRRKPKHVRPPLTLADAVGGPFFFLQLVSYLSRLRLRDQAIRQYHPRFWTGIRGWARKGISNSGVLSVWSRYEPGGSGLRIVHRRDFTRTRDLVCGFVRGRGEGFARVANTYGGEANKTTPGGELSPNEWVHVHKRTQNLYIRGLGGGPATVGGFGEVLFADRLTG